MKRRGFLAALGGAAAGLCVDSDPERALWTPGKKKIFIPSRIHTADIAFHPDCFALTWPSLNLGPPSPGSVVITEFILKDKLIRMYPDRTEILAPSPVVPFLAHEFWAVSEKSIRISDHWDKEPVWG